MVGLCICSFRALNIPTPRKLVDPGRPKYAYAIMADGEDFLLNALPMVHALRKFTSYPVIVVTNTTQFEDGTSVEAAFRKLYVTVMPIQPIDLSLKLQEWTGHIQPNASNEERKKLTCSDHCQRTFQKLQIWSYSQFDKIIMLDVDAIITRNIDEFFELQGTWAQVDMFACHGYTNDACTGFMLLEPSPTTYNGLLDALTNLTAPAEMDQIVAQKYFGSGIEGFNLLLPHLLGQFSTPGSNGLHLFKPEIAAFGNCIEWETGKLVKAIPLGPTQALQPRPWENVVPAFVHKTGFAFNCMDNSHMPDSGVRHGDGIRLCRDNAMARLWWRHYCDAVDKMGLKVERALTACTSWRRIDSF